MNLKYLAAGAVTVALMASAAMADKVLRIQSVLPNTADEVVMLKAFGDDVAALTGGSLTIEVLPAGAVVGPGRICLDSLLGRQACCSEPIWRTCRGRWCRP